MLYSLKAIFASFFFFFPNVDSALANGASLRLSRTRSASCTASGTQLELWLYKVNSIPANTEKSPWAKGICWSVTFFAWCQVLVLTPKLCRDASSAALGGCLALSSWLVISPTSAPLRPLSLLSWRWKVSMIWPIRMWSSTAAWRAPPPSHSSRYRQCGLAHSRGKFFEAQLWGVLNEAVIDQSCILLCSKV